MRLSNQYSNFGRSNQNDKARWNHQAIHAATNSGRRLASCEGAYETWRFDCCLRHQVSRFTERTDETNPLRLFTSKVNGFTALSQTIGSISNKCNLTLLVRIRSGPFDMVPFILHPMWTHIPNCAPELLFHLLNCNFLLNWILQLCWSSLICFWSEINLTTLLSRCMHAMQTATDSKTFAPTNNLKVFVFDQIEEVFPNQRWLRDWVRWIPQEKASWVC